FRVVLTLTLLVPERLRLTVIIVWVNPSNTASTHCADQPARLRHCVPRVFGVFEEASERPKCCHVASGTVSRNSSTL
ncbi:hypothetical protein, partial [Haloquadratum walsbyi]|uniref:hypothetical protein n=1 Tax=Haloquadratum walsbyi TaxID=293091 RepID=UPI001AD8C829